MPVSAVYVAAFIGNHCMYPWIDGQVELTGGISATVLTCEFIYWYVFCWIIVRIFIV